MIISYCLSHLRPCLSHQLRASDPPSRYYPILRSEFGKILTRILDRSQPYEGGPLPNDVEHFDHDTHMHFS